MTSFEVRDQFIKFFKDRQHQEYPSSALIPNKDPSLLFVNAGMNQFKSYFLGHSQPKHKRAVTIQKCLRAGGKHNDLEAVGFTARHHTFFEMMGNFSFGDYFKKKSCELAWEFLTQNLNIPENRLYVSVFEKDQETRRIWEKDLGLSSNKIFECGEEDNFWRMGDVGPCGPCSEIYYFSGEGQPSSIESMVEIWNLVFMEFYEGSKGERTPLPQACIDTGMGLERLCAILQNKTSGYDTDIFSSIIKKLEKCCDFSYRFDDWSLEESQIAFRVIADHARAVSFLISDGMIPGNEGRSYVLRRILRRAFFYSRKLNNPDLLREASSQVINDMKKIYPSLEKESARILTIVDEEKIRFDDNLKAGKKIFLEKASQLSGTKVKASLLWELYSTYGFPLDLTRLLAQEKDLQVEDIDLETLKKQHNVTSSSSSFTQKLASKDVLADYHKQGLSEKTIFTGYEKHADNVKILFLSEDKTDKGKLQAVFNTSCFYAEGGGPIGDQGYLKTKTGEARVLDCQDREGIYLHKLELVKGHLKIGQEASIAVDKIFRSEMAQTHSATHLLNHALRQLVGEEVRQAGCLLLPGKIRFDFTSDRLDEAQLNKLEVFVQNLINKNASNITQISSFDQAVREGAIYLPGENYQDKVRVVQFGDSKEFCGGIHVKNTSDIGRFKIVSETGVRSGVRRILAYTGQVAEDWITYLSEENQALRKQIDAKDLSQKESEQTLKIWFESKLAEKDRIQKNLSALRFDDKLEELDNRTNAKAHSASVELLAQQNLELRRYLKLPIPKQQASNSDLIEICDKLLKEIEVLKSLSKQLKIAGYTWDKLLKEATDFKIGKTTAKLLITTLPFKDRALLASTVDNLKARIGTSLIVARSDEEPQSKIVVLVSKDIQNKIKAGQIFKEFVAPFLEAKGGGQDRFAQGIMKNSSAFKELKSGLLDYLEKHK